MVERQMGREFGDVQSYDRQIDAVSANGRLIHFAWGTPADGRFRFRLSFR
jgi:hypothetical protein